MKPMGAIPADFRAEGGMLLIGGCGAAALAEEVGDTPLFVYDMGIVADRVRRLRDALPASVAVHYAMKANPFPPLLRRMAGLVAGFDVASAGEMRLALEAGGATRKPAAALP